jgi:gamma-glutamylcysteine synthetase
MAEQRKRLDMTIRADLRDFVEEESSRTGKPMNYIVDELLEFAIAHRRGEIIEQQSLPVIRDIVESALRRTKAELRAELREDMRLEILEALKEIIRKSTDRVIALVLRTVRDAAIIRRLVYTIIAKAYSPEFAQHVYEDAREKAGKELRPKTESEKRAPV